MRGNGSYPREPGWVKAPEMVALEIRLVWQAEDMPDEVKNSPGYSPFTLSQESQEWVDAMQELRDGGDCIYGRPKPVMPKQHATLTTPPASPTSDTGPPMQRGGPPVQPRQPPPAPHRGMPEIDDVPPAVRPGHNMPDVGEEEMRKAPRPRHRMPDIGES